MASGAKCRPNVPDAAEVLDASEIPTDVTRASIWSDGGGGRRSAAEPRGLSGVTSLLMDAPSSKQSKQHPPSTLAQTLAASPLSRCFTPAVSSADRPKSNHGNAIAMARDEPRADASCRAVGPLGVSSKNGIGVSDDLSVPRRESRGMTVNKLRRATDGARFRAVSASEVAEHAGRTRTARRMSRPARQILF